MLSLNVSAAMGTVFRVHVRRRLLVGPCTSVDGPAALGVESSSRRLCSSFQIKTLVCVFGSDEENFCATVPKDGRSYSPTLFSQTVRVLKKINKPGDVILAFGLLADKIKVTQVTYVNIKIK